MTDQSSAELENVRLHLLVLRCQGGGRTGICPGFSRGLAAAPWRTSSTLLGDAAEDVQQEVWLAVYRGIRTLGNPGAFRTWLFRTTRHRAIDFLRSRKRERELIEEASVVSVEANEPDEGTSFTALDETVLNAALAKNLTAAPRGPVAPVSRRAQLRRNRARSSAVRSGAVRTRLHHAKRRLQELLT